MDHLGYLFAAYSIIFVVIFAYVAFVWRRQAHLESELRGIEESIKSLKAQIDSSKAASVKK